MKYQEILNNGVAVGSVIRLENEDGKLHDEDGPALYREMIGERPVMEWWRNGKLVATYDGQSGKLMKSLGGEWSSLKEAVLPQKWVGRERTLSLDDLDVCSLKEQNEVKPIPLEGIRARISGLREQFIETPAQSSKLKLQ